MKVLNWGSLNIDHVYEVDHLVAPGETLASLGYSRFSGGKGANQSIALALAGACVSHAGHIGQDGVWIRDKLEALGVDTRHIGVVDGPTGHAVIQVARDGQNSIIIHGGANRHPVTVGPVMDGFGAADYLLVQNEIEGVGEVIRAAAERNMVIVFNPAPADIRVHSYPLDLVDYFVLNQIEGEQITGEQERAPILDGLLSRFPRASVVLTLGVEGVVYASGAKILEVPALTVDTVDTTAAGDTFIGYFLADLLAERDVGAALATACRAAALCVQRRGAADSIPSRSEL
jgi:ribokinase